MKIKSKKIKIIFLIISLLVLYIFGSKLISNTNYNTFSKIKSFIPNPIKHYIKNTIFIIPTLKENIKELEKKNKVLHGTINQNKETIKEIKNTYFSGSYPLISFHLKEKEKIIKSKYFNYKLTTFQTNFLNNGKAGPAKASAYIEEFDNKIFLVNADGVFSYFYKQNLNQEKFDSIVIPTNIKKIINYPAFYKRSENGIKDILVSNKKLFVSFTNKLPDECYNTSIMVADINLEY